MIVRLNDAAVAAFHRTGHPDFTGWECEPNSFHLDDVVPVRVDVSPDDEPLISEPDQLLMLRQGLRSIDETRAPLSSYGNCRHRRRRRN